MPCARGEELAMHLKSKSTAALWPASVYTREITVKEEENKARELPCATGQYALRPVVAAIDATATATAHSREMMVVVVAMAGRWS
uniref:Uncharacterized protein n=1 Tax=Oryza glumipatula TaxID=40148 RepID=A0A0D9ZHY5_9ORYZ